MSHRIILSTGILAALCAGCAVGTDGTADLELTAEEQALFAEGGLGTKEQAYGELGCPTATPNSYLFYFDQALDIQATQQNNAQCTWTHVIQINGVRAETMFTNRYSDVIPVNQPNCESISVLMDIYKYNQGAWVLDSKQKLRGVWDVWPHENACAVPILYRMAPTAGTYKIILNGRYSALSYQHRSKIRFVVNAP